LRGRERRWEGGKRGREGRKGRGKSRGCGEARNVVCPGDSAGYWRALL